MKRWIQFFAVVSLISTAILVKGQSAAKITDSTTVRLYPSYDSVSRIHRVLFGENYRKEYALETRIPVIKISQLYGGLKAVSRGGGNQTKSLRLEDSSGNEWVLRSVEKYPEVLLPTGLRQTFLETILKDNMSSQHPFSALIVPVLAEAANLPHTNPIIGLVAKDVNLGIYEKDFAGMVCLLECREPLGKSDNTEKMFRKLKEDHNNTIDAELYLRLRCLDVVLGDWDRHQDQWRWKGYQTKKGINYIPVPRDRDQVFFLSEGKIQRYTQSSWFLPMMQGFERDISNINWFLWEGREINTRWFSQIDKPQWDAIVADFCANMTDEVFEKALKRLPEPGYSLKHDQLLRQLKLRRASLPSLMDTYYHFFNRKVDIELSDKDEFINIEGNELNGLTVTVTKLKKGEKIGDILYERKFDPKDTREIRLYVHGGLDKILLNNSKSTKIALRVIAGEGEKDYEVIRSKNETKFYGSQKETHFSGAEAHRVSKHFSLDSLTQKYVAKDLYRRHFIFPELSFNNDDGIALGLSMKIKNPGFRKTPYGNSQSFAAFYSFNTSATKFFYKGEWLKAIGKADLLINGNFLSPSNTQNFFGFGNQTTFDNSSDNIKYYRARFNLYDLNVLLRRRNKTSNINFGPALQYYSYNVKDNQDRFISKTDQLHTADSAIISNKKLFAGAIVQYRYDNTDDVLMPTKGLIIDSRLSVYGGLNNYSNNFGQFALSFSFYKKIDSAAKVVIVNRTGGGVTAGKATFYQSQFLGSQGNLIGYRQFRFAGQQVLYNNFEIRWRIANLSNYIFPGQLGLSTNYDIGRVWVSEEHSNKWHQGVGAGLYFAPASLSVFKVAVSHSKEGWYPYLGLSFRY